MLLTKETVFPDSPHLLSLKHALMLLVEEIEHVAGGGDRTCFHVASEGDRTCSLVAGGGDRTCFYVAEGGNGAPGKRPRQLLGSLKSLIR